MNTEKEWLDLEDSEKIVWSGSPRLQRIVGMHVTEYILTNNAVYRKSGILSRNVQKIGLDKIQNISFSQGILGKKFGYGNVEISTAGGSGVEMYLMSVEGPKEVQETINKHIKKDKDDTKGTGTMEKILQELKKVRKSIGKIEEKI